ncbi:MAG TPA: (4Fe-4S)-binding protein [Thermodesulfatator atlanticus]|uniref:(4Fe-4S)-binding protein n=1 Tax=Thermodesulfatator atlanticus TaxID=501497 RepID=A0A7V5U3G1_9BACT|nr:(4Fe-4S)-binding protein [Thermodesulfatator atlanticus]
MPVLAVASGKGGTGKTTVSLALAESLGEEVVFLDADVEEPNAHLFLKPDLEEEVPLFRTVPRVVEERCSFCGRCKEICRFNAMVVFPGTVLCFPELCHGCYGCFEVCEDKALEEEKIPLGRLRTGRKGKIFLAYGMLEIGEAMASPLIKELKKRYLAPEKPVIIDCPPGTACPTLHAVRGADFCLLVTEPTPFGLHDLEQAAKAVKTLGVKAGVVINRADQPFPPLYDFLDRERLPLLLEIPFSKEVARAYAQAKGLLAVFPELKAAFQNLWQKIFP